MKMKIAHAAYEKQSFAVRDNHALLSTAILQVPHRSWMQGPRMCDVDDISSSLTTGIASDAMPQTEQFGDIDGSHE
jgi:hypothetical protein